MQTPPPALNPAEIAHKDYEALAKLCETLYRNDPGFQSFVDCALMESGLSDHIKTVKQFGDVIRSAVGGEPICAQLLRLYEKTEDNE